MLFNSVAFAIFLPIVFAIYWAVPHKFRCPILLISSYIFYMTCNPKYIFIILFTTAVTYTVALLLEKCNSEKKKKSVILIALISCLGLLSFYKYFNFLSTSIASLLSFFSVKVDPVLLHLILPIGISFYTFQTLGYVIDVYRGKVKAEKNFITYATFVSFFPQLVAGPIARANSLLPQITSEKKFDYDKATHGLKLMAWGFFAKLAIADVIAGHVNYIFANLEVASGFDCALAIFFYSIQVYCDFSGYSNIAIGVAELFGIDLMVNFKSPYYSKSIKEFWSRWHISLSTWFRDYLYIPLGGSRCGKFRHYFNLVLTFMISGLWHGASWNFVIWGTVHGLVQVIEKLFETVLNPFRDKNRFTKIISTLTVFFICCIVSILIRVSNMSEAIYIIKHAFTGLGDPATYFATVCNIKLDKQIMLGLTILLLFLYDYFSLTKDVIGWVSSQKVVRRWAIYVALVFLILMNAPVSNETAFVYAQF